MEILETSTMYVTLLSFMPLIDCRVRPVLQAQGKSADLFPLYVQCHLHKDAEDVRVIHEPLLRLYNSHPDCMELAQAIHRSLNCSAIMSSTSPWFVLLNGRSFRGIIQVARSVPPPLYSLHCELYANLTPVILTPRLEILCIRHGAEQNPLRTHYSSWSLRVTNLYSLG